MRELYLISDTPGKGKKPFVIFTFRKTGRQNRRLDQVFRLLEFFGRFYRLTAGLISRAVTKMIKLRLICCSGLCGTGDRRLGCFLPDEARRIS